MIKQVPQYVLVKSSLRGGMEPIAIMPTLELLAIVAEEKIGIPQCSIKMGNTIMAGDGDYSVMFIPPVASITQAKSAVKKAHKKELVRFFDSVISSDGLYRTIEWEDTDHRRRMSDVRMHIDGKARVTAC